GNFFRGFFGLPNGLETPVRLYSAPWFSNCRSFLKTHAVLQRVDLHLICLNVKAFLIYNLRFTIFFLTSAFEDTFAQRSQCPNTNFLQLMHDLWTPLTS